MASVETFFLIYESQKTEYVFERADERPIMQILSVVIDHWSNLVWLRKTFCLLVLETACRRLDVRLSTVVLFESIRSDYIWTLLYERCVAEKSFFIQSFKHRLQMAIYDQARASESERTGALGYYSVASHANK